MILITAADIVNLTHGLQLLMQTSKTVKMKDKSILMLVMFSNQFQIEIEKGQ